MIYRAIGLMSGSSLDGLDVVCAEFHVNAGHWAWEILAADCLPYSAEWRDRLAGATELSARDYLLLHSEYGRYLGRAVNAFIEQHELHYKIGLIASHGHTTFHLPGSGMTAQLGDGAALAAETALPVVSDLRALDVAFGGQGAPIVPLGESLLFRDYRLFLNLGGIANIAVHDGPPVAWDVCPANRVLNALAQKEGQEYDADGALARSGRLHESLLAQLNELPFYSAPAPKSLANDFGTGTVLPMIEAAGISTADALRTVTEHIALQVARALAGHPFSVPGPKSLLITGGGAFNSFLVERLSELLKPLEVSVQVPEEALVQYKEALIMAALGVLRWRQEYTVLASVTGARRDSIGGALWTGQEA
ncbi:anhydro-N-acetylmuramic acid kinase [Flaviaesturariibacter amylovorans]|uniref:Anhydro-N-acetylmuramic acid kinase n=1 Tax=Flaviaesturariibacter amylovorans TaxID=1084520 RepID=A0ABP8G8G3_9BACT